MKKESKGNIMKTIKILTIILLIVLVSMVGFFGIYKQNKNQMSNIVKDYTYAMDLNGARTLKLALNSENGDDVKTEENYKTAKNVIEKRLKKLGVEEYKISLNKQTGKMVIQIPEDTNTDKIVSSLTTIGKLEIIDSETKEVLLDNSSIESSSVLYNTTTSGTAVYLEIAFNKDGKSKLEEMSKTYVKSENNTTENTASNETTENTNSEGTNSSDETNTTTDTSTSTEKKITMKIDDEEIMSTSFEEPITTGKIQLSVGKATTDTSTLNGYIQQAQSVVTELDSGKLPVKYDLEKNQYILSNISKQNLTFVAIGMVVVAIIAIIVLIIKYKMNGLLVGISYVGFSALYLLVLRYTNVAISIDSIVAIAIVLILNYVFVKMLLSNIKKMNKDNEEDVMNKSISEGYKKFFNRIIPIGVIVVVFCFTKWVSMSSFGMTAFWGIVIIAIYNVIITNGLLRIKNK